MATTKMMVAEGKTFWHKQSGEYETAHLRTPYKMVEPMLNRIFSKADERSYKFGWIPLIYHVAMKGTVFNWADIVANSLSISVTATHEGLHQRNLNSIWDLS